MQFLKLCLLTAGSWLAHLLEAVGRNVLWKPNTGVLGNDLAFKNYLLFFQRT